MAAGFEGQQGGILMFRGHFDGASRGNPGPAGAGAVLYEDGRVIWEKARPLGEKTNNEAEYAALALLLDELEKRGVQQPEICGDSRLVISQVTGVWKIKEPRLQALASPLIDRIRALGAKCVWVPREQNAEADRMSNWALDKGPYEKKQNADDCTAAPLQNAEPVTGKNASAAEPPSLRCVGEHIWLVSEGGETYAVDLPHRRCTCSRGGDGACRHIEAVLLEDLFCAK